MIYFANNTVGIRQGSKDISHENNSTPIKIMQQNRRQAFNEMSSTLFQQQNQTQTSSTLFSSKRSNTFNTNPNRLNQSFNSFAQSKIQSPRRLSVHRSSLTPSMLLKQANDQFSAKKAPKNGVALRLSQVNCLGNSTTKNDSFAVHIDDILDSFRNSPSRQNEIKKIQQTTTTGTTNNNLSADKQKRYSSSQINQNGRSYELNENINTEFSNTKINQKLSQFSSDQINFIKPDSIQHSSGRKINQKGERTSERSSLQNNAPDTIDNNNRNLKQLYQQNDNMNNFLSEIDATSAFNSQSKFNSTRKSSNLNNLDELSIQHSRASTNNAARRENSITGYAIFKQTDTPLNPSFSQFEDDLSRSVFSTQSNHFRITKRNNPYKRFYKKDQNNTDNILYRYIDTQSENSPAKLSQGAFKKIIEKTDQGQSNSKSLSDGFDISQYYNPVKNNMTNLVDGEGKVYKKHYALSIQNRIDYLKNQKIQNEAQMMLINYNIINEVEQTSKLIYKQLPSDLANKFSNIVNTIKSNIYHSAKTQQSNNQTQNEFNHQSRQSQSSISHLSQDRSVYQYIEDSDVIYRQVQTEY